MSRATRHRRFISTVIGTFAVLFCAALASAHDMFLRAERFFVAPNSDVVIRLLNGTFLESENAIVRGRVRDASVSGARARSPIDMDTWTETGDTTTFRVRVGASGTYAVGISTRPSIIALSGADFNAYLKDDGVPDILADRGKRKELGDSAKERYHKHVKALLQVGDSLGRAFGTVFGYPAEIVPLENPYALRSGGTLRIRALVNGKPVPSQYILYGGRNANGTPIPERSTRSLADGTARIPISSAGEWYIKFIHMTRQAASDSVDYESKWATLTFAVR
jgi:uncharacterized GH25 family protein